MVHRSLISSCLLFIFLFSIKVNAQPDLMYYRCKNYIGNHTNSSYYKENLNGLLSALPATDNGNGFFNASFGRDSNRAHAIGLCRGDVGPDTCRSCLMNATLALPRVCPNQKEAVGWYDFCIVRFSNRLLVGIYETYDLFYMRNTKNVSFSASAEFFTTLQKLLDGLKNSAAAGGSFRKVTAGNVTASEFMTLYVMAQCSPDISQRDCNNCLDYSFSLIPECCGGKIGGRVEGTSCNFRYEVYTFLQPIEDVPLQAFSPSPSPLSLPAPRNHTAPTIETRV